MEDTTEGRREAPRKIHTLGVALLVAVVAIVAGSWMLGFWKPAREASAASEEAGSSRAPVPDAAGSGEAAVPAAEVPDPRTFGPDQLFGAFGRALRDRDIAAFRKLLDERPDAPSLTRSGSTLLHIAALVGRVDEAGLLLDRGAEIDATTPRGVTPLFGAAMNGHEGVVAMLIARGADPDLPNEAGTSALMIAISQGHPEVAMRLVDAGAAVGIQTTGNRSTALMLASGQDDLDLVRALLARGADPTHADRFGNTARSYAKSDSVREALDGSGAEEEAEAPDAQQAEQEIRRVFDRFIQALVAEDGEAAAREMASATLDRYGSFVAAALDMSESDLRKRPAGERLVVLRVRHEHSPAELRVMTGAGLFAAGVESGQLGSDLQSLTLGDIDMRGRLASAVGIVRGVDAGIRLTFVLEAGRWCFDMSPLIEVGAAQIESLLQSRGEDVDAEIVKRIAELSDREVAATIWQPVGR